eukprot:scaffold963_cov103-Skeletonema_dohrnii-CCMP3373.AAC.9
MSGVDEPERNNTMMFCAACGIAGVEDIKLKNCTACYLVKYCSVKCQRDHRPQHKKECKKRAAELRDEILFKQPESTHLGDCPICCLPLPIDENKFTIMECCSKTVCDGCYYASVIYERDEKIREKCPFCRSPAPDTHEEAIENLMKRVEANDSVALYQMGRGFNLDENYKSAFEYFSKGAELGDIESHYELSCLYLNREGVEKDEKKRVYHLEVAAIGGHPTARYYLGCVEKENGRMDRSVKHWIIAAKLGHEPSLDLLKLCYRDGLIGKDDLAAALRAHQTAVDDAKSAQREAGVAFHASC